MATKNNTILDELEKERKKRYEEAKADIIEALFYTDIIQDIGYYDYQISSGWGEAIDKLERTLKPLLKDPHDLVDISNYVNDLAADQELSGFRQGFSLALKIIFQGMAGKPLPGKMTV